MPVKDPFLDSINHMLMEEGVEDATCIQQDGGTSYQAILCGFYDIIEKQNVEHHNGGPSTVTTPNILQSSLFQEESGDSSLVVPGLVHNFISPNSDDLNEAQHHHAAVKSNEGELSDTKVSCRKKRKDLNDFRSCSDRGSNARFQLPSPYKQFSLKLAGVELSFEDLKLHDHYAALYVGEPSIPAAGHPKYRDKEKAQLAVAGKGGKYCRKRAANAQDYVDLKPLMLNCGQAVAVGDARVANELLQGILQQAHGASAYGNGSQRAAHYFSEALVARIRGTGGHLSKDMLHFRQPPAVTYLKAKKLYFEVCPLQQVSHYFANQSILKAAEGASRVHIVDYGNLEEYGIQWPFLINALADQKGGPPLLVITSIDHFPEPGNNRAGRLEESGRRLAAHARTYNVPFQYHAIACSKWEDLDSSSFHLHEDEVLVVNCRNSLRHLTNEGVDLVSPCEKLFTCIHRLEPHLLIIADFSAAFNSSCFVSRFREALYFYSSMFDMIDTVWGDIPERLVMERMLYSLILNTVACEGAERVERSETFKQWEVRIKRAGFAQLLIPPPILCRSRSYAKQHYHKDFFVHDDANKWMLVGWKGRTLGALSAWKLA